MSGEPLLWLPLTPSFAGAAAGNSVSQTYCTPFWKTANNQTPTDASTACDHFEKSAVTRAAFRLSLSI